MSGSSDHPPATALFKSQSVLDVTCWLHSGTWGTGAGLNDRRMERKYEKKKTEKVVRGGEKTRPQRGTSK